MSWCEVLLNYGDLDGVKSVPLNYGDLDELFHVYDAGTSTYLETSTNIVALKTGRV